MQKMKLFCPKIQDDCQLQMVTIVVVFKGLRNINKNNLNAFK